MDIHQYHNVNRKDKYTTSWMYLLVNSDRPDDHLFSLLSFHVVQTQGVDLGSQVASHLKKVTVVIFFWGNLVQCSPDRTGWSPELQDVHQWSLHWELHHPCQAGLHPGRREKSHLGLLCCPAMEAPGTLHPWRRHTNQIWSLAQYSIPEVGVPRSVHRGWIMRPCFIHVLHIWTRWPWQRQRWISRLAFT